MKLAYVLLGFLFSSCALLLPSESISLVPVTADYSLARGDTTGALLHVAANLQVEFTLNGSNTMEIRPGESEILAGGIQTGWYYINIIGDEMRVVNLPVYLHGGHETSFTIAHNYLDIDGRTFFNSYQEKSTQYPFYPQWSFTCYGCNFQPLIRFDGSEITITRPWMTITPGWHTIEIYSPLDHVQLYYRRLFDSFTITQFDLYPVHMF